MGQSSWLPEAPAEHSSREISTSRRFSFKTVAIASSSTDEDSELYGEVTQGPDYTSDLPDECLASIFHFLCAGDRKRSSLVCHRCLRVDGQSRHRLSQRPGWASSFPACSLRPLRLGHEACASM
ncbi:hypothetical protein ACFX2J_018468 [Malus domestica]